MITRRASGQQLHHLYDDPTLNKAIKTQGEAVPSSVHFRYEYSVSRLRLDPNQLVFNAYVRTI